MKIKCLLILLLVAAFSIIPRQSPAQILSADNISYRLFVNDRFDLMSNYYDNGRRSFDQDRNLHVLYVAPAATVQLGPYMQAVAEAEGQFTYAMGDNELDHDIDLRNAYLKTSLPGARWTTLSVGQQSLSTAGGFIYDDESPTLRVKADLEKGFDLPLKLDALITRIKKGYPYLHAELRYCFSLLECGSFIYGNYRGRDNGIAKTYNFIDITDSYRSRSTTQWFGLSLRKFFGPVLMRSTALYETGSAHVRNISVDTASRSMRTRGYLLDMNFDYMLTERLTLTGFFFMESGDGSPKKGTFTAFYAINPYIDKTNIFFNGGIDSEFSSDHGGIRGMQIAGVATPGVSLDFRLNPATQIKLIGAYLFTQRGPAHQGRVYGWETDCMGYYSLSENLQLFSEVNVFKQGTYFRHLTQNRTDLTTEFLFGISYLFGN